MKIQVQFDSARLLALVQGSEKRLAYEVTNAINDTAKQAQAAVRASVLSRFTVRQKQFITRNAAKIDRTSFANPKRGQAWAEIAVGQVQTGHRPLLLSTFEKGGVREPFVGHNIAVPILGGPARRTRTSRVPAEWQFQNLRFQKSTTRTGKDVWVSANRRAYLIPGVGVFQRGGAGAHPLYGSTMVYAFVPSSRIDTRLGFEATVRRIADRNFSKNVGHRIGNAIAYIRSHGG